MPTLPETLYDITRVWPLRILRSALMITLLLTVYSVTTFYYSANNTIVNKLSENNNKNLIKLIDTLTNPNEFHSYSQSTKGINEAYYFYKALTTKLHGGTYIPAHNQTVATTNLQLQKFHANPDINNNQIPLFYDKELGGKAFEIKSSQLNEAAWKFYNLQLEGNRLFQLPDSLETNVTDPVQIAPIYLGSLYKGTYKEGDKIILSYYQKKMNFIVKGFLKPDSTIYLHGNINYYLDDHIIIPYPQNFPNANSMSSSDRDFYRKIIFAMINGNIAMNKDTNFNSILNEVDALAKNTNYNHYSFIGTSDYQVKFKLIRNLLTNNIILVSSIIIIETLLILFIIIWVAKILGTARSTHSKLLTLLGATSKQMLKIRFFSSSCYWFFSILILGILFTKLEWHSYTSFKTLVTTGLIYAIAEFMLDNIFTKRMANINGQY